MRRHSIMLLVLLLLLGQGAVARAAEEPADEAPPEPPGHVERSPSAPDMTPEEKADAEIGASAAEEVERTYDILEDCPELPRLAETVRRLRPATEKPYHQYQIKVLDSQAINAFALPGGYLYVTDGLLEAVESEDELAAVLGHEMAHVCLMHSRKLMSKDERYQQLLGSILLVSILTNSDSVDPGALATVGSLVVRDALNHYGREAELEADAHALEYLHESGKYNPVAVLTVVEGLARLESARPNVEMGVLQTHPGARKRVQAVIEHLTELGIPVERRRVTHSLTAEAAAVTVDEEEIGELRLNGRSVYRPAVSLDGLSPVARAQQSAERLNELLLENLALLEIESRAVDGAVHLKARDETILRITPEDAAFHDSTVEELLQRAMGAIRLGFSEEKVERAY